MPCLLELGLTWSGNPSLIFNVKTALAAFQAIDIRVDHFHSYLVFTRWRPLDQVHMRIEDRFAKSSSREH